MTPFIPVRPPATGLITPPLPQYLHRKLSFRRLACGCCSSSPLELRARKQAEFSLIPLCGFLYSDVSSVLHWKEKFLGTYMWTALLGSANDSHFSPYLLLGTTKVLWKNQKVALAHRVQLMLREGLALKYGRPRVSINDLFKFTFDMSSWHQEQWPWALESKVAGEYKYTQRF